MSILDRVLDNPSYGYERDGVFYSPSQGEIYAEFFSRLNIFRDKKNWLGFFSWVTSASLAIPMYIFLRYHFSLGLLAVGLFYSMVVLGSHGTFWLHRHGTHRAFRFRNQFFAAICRNLVIKIIPEETYIISHHVHHRLPEKPGDPYNGRGGWLYCFLADVNHQAIHRDLSKDDYGRLCKLIDHTGVRLNSYKQYRRWGSLANPASTVAHFALNWAFWYGVFYFLGGTGLAVAIFGTAGIWAFGVRTFNFDGHGRGVDRRRVGVDFNLRDESINQVWPGYVAGEWHNNHHLYPNGARSGFLPHQLDLPWLLIWTLNKMGWISSYRDYKVDFYRDHYLPYVASQEAQLAKSATL